MRSLRNRLAFLFFAITLAAIGVLYLYVVPQLESRLRDEKLSQLTIVAQRTAPQIAATVGGDLPAASVARIVRAASDAANARVTLLRIGRVGGLPAPDTITDSSESGEEADPGVPELALPTADEAARRGRVTAGSEVAADGPVAEVAVPLRENGRVTEVAVYSTPMADVERNVAIVRAQILVAGGIALVLAVVAGWLIARALAQRVKRLEKAAEQVAAGDFSRPIPVDSDDELGQLAVAFNDMQRQLAQLDRARKQFIATASRSCRSTCLTCRGWRPGRASCALSRSTCRSWRAPSAPSSSRCSRSTTRTWRSACRASPSRRSATRCGSRRSCGS